MDAQGILRAHIQNDDLLTLRSAGVQLFRAHAWDIRRCHISLLRLVKGMRRRVQGSRFNVHIRHSRRFAGYSVLISVRRWLTNVSVASGRSAPWYVHTSRLASAPVSMLRRVERGPMASITSLSNMHSRS